MLQFTILERDLIMGFKNWGIMLYLDKHLYMGFIKLQADKKLGRSFAGLLAFVEGLYQMGYISEKHYQKCKKRYSTPLDKDPLQITLQEHNKAQERRVLNKVFADVLDQFDLHKDKPGWVDHWLRKAEKNGELSNAKRLVAFIQERKT
jgi:hypothetical protein